MDIPHSLKSRKRSLSTADLELRLALVWLGAFVCLMAMALHARLGGVSHLDLSLWSRIHDAPGFLTPLLRLDNDLGDPLFWSFIVVSLSCLLLIRRHALEAALMMSCFVPAALQFLLKELVREPPPFVQRSTGPFSFPSGHVVALTVLFSLVIVLAPKLVGRREWPVRALRALAILVIFTVGVARVWATAHWPSDVVAGYLFAMLFLIPALAFYRDVVSMNDRRST